MSDQECEVVRFRYGGCYAMAYALAETLGWTVECVSAQWSELPNFPHAWVVDATGRAFDAFGFTTREAIHDEYITNDGRVARYNATVRVERFETPDAFLSRLKEGYGHPESIQEYEAFFRREVLKAKAILQSTILPKHLPEYSA